MTAKQGEGVGISEIAKGTENKYDGQTWLCPLCDHKTDYGKMGCDDPKHCQLAEKNIHWEMIYRRKTIV